MNKLYWTIQIILLVFMALGVFCRVIQYLAERSVLW